MSAMQCVSHAICQPCNMPVVQNVSHAKCEPIRMGNVRHESEQWKMCVTTKIPMENVRHSRGPHGKYAPQQSAQWNMCVTTAIQMEIFSSLIFQRNFSRLAGCPRSIGAFSMRSKADEFNFQNLYVSLFGERTTQFFGSQPRLCFRCRTHRSRNGNRGNTSFDSPCCVRSDGD